MGRQARGEVILVLIVACVAAAGCTVPPLAATSTPTVPTSTPPPPTLTPTATVTPTPTEIPVGGTDPRYPNAGPKPEGATGLRGDNWIKTRDGVVYTWKVLQINNQRDSTVTGWFISHILGASIPLAGGGVTTDLVPYYFDVQDGLRAPSLKHPKQIQGTGILDFAGIMNYQLISQTYQESGRKISLAETRSFFAALRRNDVYIPFTTHTGRFVWKPGEGYRFYAVSWEEADPTVHPEFYETGDDLLNKSLLYRWVLYANADGQLICVGAVEDPSALTEIQFLGWILHPMEKVLTQYSDPPGLKLSDIGTAWALPYYPSTLVDGARGMGEAAPEFEIIPAP